MEKSTLQVSRSCSSINNRIRKEATKNDTAILLSSLHYNENKIGNSPGQPQFNLKKLG
jgi:hypothetical protein